MVDSTTTNDYFKVVGTIPQAPVLNDQLALGSKTLVLLQDEPIFAKRGAVRGNSVVDAPT
jgi:hypothetical protein